MFKYQLFNVSILPLGTPFPCCLCKVSAVPQYHLAMVDGTIRNFCSYDCVSIYRVREPVVLELFFKIF